MVFNDGIYLVIDEWLFIADRVFYPLIIGISVVAYSYTNGIISHPDALFTVNVDIIDGISVHWVVPVIVSNNVWYRFIGIGIHFVDTGPVCSYEDFIVIVGTDTVNTNVHQSGWDMHDFVLIQVIGKYSPLESTDKNLVRRFMIV